MKKWLGLCSCYCRFVKDYAKIAYPLNRILCKDQKFNWTKECQTSFDLLKQILLTPPVLTFPDFNKTFILSTDASNYVTGAILSQKDEQGYLHPIAYASKPFSKTERSASISEKELATIVFGVQHFSIYLLAKEFVLQTDHKGLSFLMKSNSPNAKLQRQALFLAAYKFTIEYIPGKLNSNADALSLMEEPESTQTHEDCLIISEQKASRDNDVLIATIYSWKPATSAIHQKQLDCPWMKVALDLSEKGEISQDLPSEVQKWLLRNTNNFSSRKGLLYYKADLSERNFQLVVPETLRPVVIYEAHNSELAAHPGVDKTLNRIEMYYYWPHMKDDIVSYCKVCMTCAKTKHPNYKTKCALQPLPIPSYPFEIVSMDIIGPLPMSEHGNRFLLVIIDLFTKYPEAIPLEHKSSMAVATVFLEHFITCFGCPRVISTDAGS